MVAVAFVPVTLLIARLAIDERHSTSTRARDEAMRLLDSAVVEQRDLLRGAREVIQSLAQLPDVADGPPTVCTRTLTRLVGAFQHYTGATRITPNRRVDCSSVPIPDSLADLSDAPAMQMAVRTGQGVSGYYRVGRSTRALATVIEPIRAATGEVRFYLAVDVELPWFDRLIATLPPQAGSMIAISDTAGFIYARAPDPEGFAGRLQPRNDVFRQMIARERGFAEGLGLDGRQRLYAFRTLPAANPDPVQVTIGIPTAVLYADANRHLRENVLVTVVTLVLAMTMAWIAADLFVLRDVRRLLEATDRLAEGDLSTRVPRPAGGGELRELAQHFNALAERLDARRREFAMLGDATPDAVMRVGPDLTVQWANATILRFLDVSLDGIVGCSIQDLRPDTPGLTRTIEQIRLAFQTRATREFEDHAITERGELWLDVRVIPERDAEGAVSSVLLVARDITARKHLEVHLAHSERLDSIGKLAGSIAHDFNNLLTAIIGNADLALRALEPGHPVRADLAEILDVARRASSLTRQLLSFARRHPTAPRVIDVNPFLDESAAFLRRLMGPAITVELRLDPAAPHIRFDPAYFEQVLINLATNARDAMPGGGTLTISTARATLGGDDLPATGDVAPGDYLALEITDTGIGMEPAVRERIFEPFFTTKRDHDGTGLGLAMTYGMVRQHGGFIVVESAPGKGATFRLHFPATEDPAECAAASPSVPPAPTGRESVLVVEDQEQVRTTIARVLRLHGYRVIEARDGVDALGLEELGKLRDLHLIITDLVMPRMGGEALVAALRHHHPTTSVLLISGFDERGSARDLIERGDAAALLEKPFDSRVLLEKVRELLDRAPVVSGGSIAR